MKKILLLCSVLISTMMVAQGHETFNNFEPGGNANSYQNGTFVGDNGIVWNYLQCRGDIELNGKALTLGRNRAEGQALTSGTISGGIGTLEFAYMQAFANNTGLQVYVNDNLVYTAVTDNEKDIPKNTGAIEINVEGDFVLKMVNPENVGQITVDDIIWTAHGTVGIEDNDFVGFSFYPNPASSVLNLKANQMITNVVAFNLLGQQVISKNQFLNNKVDLSSLTSGAYIFRVTFENGTERTFKVIKN